MHPVHCPACDAPGEPGSKFCGDCGAFLRDDTTRYLCAAVHLDPDFCRDALDELAVEPARAQPPSPGVNAAAVLRDALAARARRRLRDGLLAALFVLLFLFSPALFAGWLALAWPYRVMRTLSLPRTPLIVAAATLVGLVLAGIATIAVDEFLTLAAGISAMMGNGSATGLFAFLTEGGGVRTFVALLVVMAMTAVVGLDTYWVNWLVRERFRRGRFRPDPRVLNDGDRERTLRTFAHETRRTEITRIEAAVERAPGEGEVPLVVHRGLLPFVGSGEMTAHESLAVSLVARQTTSGDAPRGVDVLAAHDWIATALGELRRASSLGPGGRLAALRIDEVVLLPADDLVEQADTDLAVEILPRLRPPYVDRAPASSLPTARARELAVAPREWARYYRRYRVETWNRELVMTTYVHIGVDERNLYLERVHCVLPPLKERFRAIDVPVTGLQLAAEAVSSLVTFPASIPDRFRQCGSASPVLQPDDVLIPFRYGAGTSLRELAAGECRTYFQHADVQRYTEIVDRVLLRAVGAYLEDCGYSAVEFQEAFTQTIHQDYRGAQFANSAVGPGASVTNGPSSAPKGKK